MIFKMLILQYMYQTGHGSKMSSVSHASIYVEIFTRRKLYLIYKYEEINWNEL